MVARLLDALVLAALIGLLEFILDGVAWLVTALWVTVVYFFLCEAFVGQTLGKRALGLRVVRRDGGPPTANAIATRNVIRIFEEPLLALLVLLGSGRRRQRLGDFAGGTTVGVENASVPPHPSGLRLLYPAIWAGLAVVIVLTARTSEQPSDRGPTLGSPIKNAALAAPGAPEKADYLFALQELCQERDRHITSHPTGRIDAILRYELAYTEKLAAIEAPQSMVGLRRHILFERRRLDRVTQEMTRRMIAGEPKREVLVSMGPRVKTAVKRSEEAFFRAGVSCVAGPP